MTLTFMAAVRKGDTDVLVQNGKPFCAVLAFSSDKEIARYSRTVLAGTQFELKSVSIAKFNEWFGEGWRAVWDGNWRYVRTAQYADLQDMLNRADAKTAAEENERLGD